MFDVDDEKRTEDNLWEGSDLIDLLHVVEGSKHSVRCQSKVHPSWYELLLNTRLKISRNARTFRERK